MSLFVCVKCRADMHCDKNGVGVEYGHGHVYPGDRWKCPACGSAIINTTGLPIHDPELRAQAEYLISNQTTTPQWYAYLHTNNAWHTKRYSGDPGDLEEAENSDFVQLVIGPFEANDKRQAIMHLAELLSEDIKCKT